MPDTTDISVEEIKDTFPNAQPEQYLCYLRTLYTDDEGEFMHEDITPVNVSDDEDDVQPSDYKLQKNEEYTVHRLVK